METFIWLSSVLVLWQACELRALGWSAVFQRDLRFLAFWHEPKADCREQPTRAVDEDRRERQPPRGAA